MTKNNDIYTAWVSSAYGVREIRFLRVKNRNIVLLDSVEVGHLTLNDCVKLVLEKHSNYKKHYFNHESNKVLFLNRQRIINIVRKKLYTNFISYLLSIYKRKIKVVGIKSLYQKDAYFFDEVNKDIQNDVD